MEQQAIKDLEDKIKTLEERIKHLEQWEKSQNYLTRSGLPSPPHNEKRPDADDPIAPDVSLHW